MKTQRKKSRYEKPRYNSGYAFHCGRIVAEKIRPMVQKLAYVGSFRRLLPTCGDIDILIIPKEGIRESQINSEFARLCVGGKLEISGSGMSKGFLDDESAVTPVNLFFTKAEEWGAAMMWTTGSRDYDIACRAIARKRGLKLNQYGVFVRSTDKLIPGSSYSEHAVCRTIGIPYLPPKYRIGTVFP